MIELEIARLLLNILEQQRQISPVVRFAVDHDYQAYKEPVVSELHQNAERLLNMYVLQLEQDFKNVASRQ